MARLESIDFLRGVAVIAVILHHHPFTSATLQFGWMGVDLFFCLSGFLVSGLLFREYQKNGEVRRLRFLIRRGLKIYPTFYFSIACAIFVRFYALPNVEGLSYSEKAWAIVSELFFFQNYVAGLMPHHWSLAVEEHFYILLALTFPFIVRRIVPVAVGVLSGTLILRIVTYLMTDDPNQWDVWTPTHLRLDSLFFGVLIAYAYHFGHLNYARLRPYLILALPIPLLYNIMPQGISVTIGYSLLYLSFGSWLIVFLYEEMPQNFVFRLIARLGVYSYSIYLFHFYWSWFAELPFWEYVLYSILTGIAVAKIVELPVLAVRDRYFPSHSSLPDGKEYSPSTEPIGVPNFQSGLKLTEAEDPA
jgi:peptidoglycan/LPS O-acetylase OafA/YrhL